MGKGSGTRARARKLEARKALPELAAVPRREADGKTTRKKRTAALRADRKPCKTALQARARMMGKDVRDAEEMRHQALGEPAGRAIFSVLEGRDAARLWDVYAGLTAAEARYAKIVLGVPINAKVAKIEFLPERMETNADDALDLRSDDEKHRDAVNSWMRWRGYVQHLDSRRQAAIWDVVRGRTEPMKDGKVTASGGVLVLALRDLAEVVDKAA